MSFETAHNASDFYMKTLVELLNKGKYQEAFELSRYIRFTPGFEASSLSRSAQFYFMAALAASLSHPARHPGLVIDLQEKARGCEDFTPEMEGDLLRDLILAACRLGMVSGRIPSMLEQLGELHGNERFSNRYAALLMTRGRVLYAQGKSFGGALELFRHAEELFAHLAWGGGDVDWQWRRNNRFAMLRTAAHVNHRSVAKIASDILFDEDEQVSRRKLLAKLLQSLSWSRTLCKVAITAYDLAERKASR